MLRESRENRRKQSRVKEKRKREKTLGVLEENEGEIVGVIRLKLGGNRVDPTYLPTKILSCYLQLTYCIR